MIKIVFVCLGNICRSPMAEFIMKETVRKEGLTDRFLIESRATSSEEIYNSVGADIYPPAQAVLRKHGIPFFHRHATQLLSSDYEQYDLILCMDSNNYRNILRITGGDPQSKVKKLLSYLGTDADIADPWYSDNFDLTYRQISDGCTALLHTLLTK